MNGSVWRIAYLSICLTMVFQCTCKPVDVSSRDGTRHTYIRIKRQSDGACPVGTCANGGTCVEGEGGYSCLCPPGFTPQSSCKEKEESSMAAVIGGSVAGAAVCIFIIIIITCLCCKTHSRARHGSVIRMAILNGDSVYFDYVYPDNFRDRSEEVNHPRDLTDIVDPEDHTYTNHGAADSLVRPNNNEPSEESGDVADVAGVTEHNYTNTEDTTSSAKPEEVNHPRDLTDVNHPEDHTYTNHGAADSLVRPEEIKHRRDLTYVNHPEDHTYTNHGAADSLARPENDKPSEECPDVLVVIKDTYVNTRDTPSSAKEVEDKNSDDDLYFDTSEYSVQYLAREEDVKNSDNHPYIDIIASEYEDTGLYLARKKEVKNSDDHTYCDDTYPYLARRKTPGVKDVGLPAKLLRRIKKKNARTPRITSFEKLDQDYAYDFLSTGSSPTFIPSSRTSYYDPYTFDSDPVYRVHGEQSRLKRTSIRVETKKKRNRLFSKLKSKPRKNIQKLLQAKKARGDREYISITRTPSHPTGEGKYETRPILKPFVADKRVSSDTTGEEEYETLTKRSCFVADKRNGSEDMDVHRMRKLPEIPREVVEIQKNERMKRLKEAEQLKEHLKDWLSRHLLASGIDIDDQKLTIFVPEGQTLRIYSSFLEELGNVEPHLGQRFKITTISEPFSIERESVKAGAGSYISYKDSNGSHKVTAGALFVNLIDNKVYILTTCHLDDASDRAFYLKDGDSEVLLGTCVANVCQTNPVIEACLVELAGHSLDKCSPLLPTCDVATMSAFSGPFRGSFLELLAAPKEVMKFGASTGLTRGKMKYFAYDFPDPSTNTMIYGGIVTLPVDTSQQFSLPGDSGAIISTASAQPYLVKSWGIDCNRNQMGERDIKSCPLNADNTVAKEVDDSSVGEAVVDAEVQEQTVPKAIYQDLHVPEVQAHEALSVHCFGYYMTIPGYGRTKVSISFRVTLAIEKLQEEIGAELALVPILRDSSQNSCH